MSDLITNLNQIYATKLQIKSVLGTESDTFSEYPSIIQDKIDENTPEGYAYITTNGDHDIASYAYVNVAVQGGVAVLGDLSVSENGVYAASSYAYDGFENVTVEVPIDWNAVENTYGYVLPTGSYTATSNGTFDISAYQNVIVDTPINGDGSRENPYTFDYVYSIDDNYPSDLNGKFLKAVVCQVDMNWENGIVYAEAMGYLSADGTNSGNVIEFDSMSFPASYNSGVDTFDAYTMASLQVGQEVKINMSGWDGVHKYIGQSCITDIIAPTSGELNITSNGHYNVQSYVSAYVNVSGGGPSTITVSGQYLIGKGGSSNEYTINRGFYYVYDDNNSTYYTLTEALGNSIDRPKLGDTVSVTGTILNGNVISPTSYSVTATPTYQYVDLSNFELSGTGDKEIAYVVNAIGAADRLMTYDNKWGYYPGGDYYNIIADSVSDVSFGAGNDITAYIVSEAVYEDGYYGYTYYIRDIVKNQSPIITGLDYSTDHGENWNSMSFDSSEMVYLFDGISISENNMVSISFRAHLDSGSYMYFGDASLEITSPATTVTADLNKSRNSMLSVSIMDQTMSEGTLSGNVSTSGSTISARITS